MLEALKPAHSRAKRLTKTMIRLRALIARIRFSDRVHSALSGRVTRVRKVTIESERLLVVIHQKGVKHWCPGCSAGVMMVGVEEAVAIAAVSRRIMLRRIGERRVHFTETTPGEFLICLSSLLEKQQIGE
jgi:hypothetical protein